MQFIEYILGLVYAGEYNSVSQIWALTNPSAILAFQFGMTLFPPLLHAFAPVWKKSEFGGGTWCALVLSSSLSNQGKGQSGIVLASDLEKF